MGCQLVSTVAGVVEEAGEAQRANRLHNQVQPNATKLERASEHQAVKIDGFTEEQAEGLREKGHEIEWIDCEKLLSMTLIAVSYSTTCVIKIGYDGEVANWEPAPEPRKEDSGGVDHNSGDGAMA
jgi:gamma-glutamyltranspeptidase/glutathione hydrolase